MNPSSNAISERGFSDKMLTESPIGHYLIHCNLNWYSRLAGEIYYCICVGFLHICEANSPESKDAQKVYKVE
jgi:hypothetical protein